MHCYLRMTRNAIFMVTFRMTQCEKLSGRTKQFEMHFHALVLLSHRLTMLPLPLFRAAYICDIFSLCAVHITIVEHRSIHQERARMLFSFSTALFLPPSAAPLARVFVAMKLDYYGRNSTSNIHNHEKNTSIFILTKIISRV